MRCDAYDEKGKYRSTAEVRLTRAIFSAVLERVVFELSFPHSDFVLGLRHFGSYPTWDRLRLAADGTLRSPSVVLSAVNQITIVPGETQSATR